MISFASTRSPGSTPFEEALFGGLAPDGGLYVPTDWPTLPAPPSPAWSFVEAAQWAAPRLLPGMSAALIHDIVTDAFDFPIPLIEVEPDTFVLELFHGPTHAFKDVGARFMARAMQALGAGRPGRTILAATSGDTGGAVADAFHGLADCRVVLLFPKDGVSDRQRKQMTTLGGNVLALAVRGTFDDCQRLAKQAFRDETLASRYGLASANSINIGRLLPQSLYYIYAAGLLGWSDRPARFSVPCGNLGNLCAGLLACFAGMPARRFLAATNANRGFADYLENGAFVPRPSVPTHSNAMDVGDPSNLERITWLYRNDPSALPRLVKGRAVSDEDTRDCIAEVYSRTGYVLDPHTAVAYHAARRSPDTGPTVVLSTAHPAKFPDLVREATGIDVPLPAGLERALGAEEHMEEMDAELAALGAALGDWWERS